MAKTPITPAELQAHFDEQLGFMERSAAAFDAGFEDEAKRLAVSMRVLLHETQRSRSVLGQLGRLNGLFHDTSWPVDEANVMPHGGLVFIAAGPPKTRYVAMLDDVPVKKDVPFQDWWDALIFVDGDKKSLSRKQLVLITANQDGGAHVDPQLDETYHKLSRQNSLNWQLMENGQAHALDGPERAAIRQIAHEVLKTLKPSYSKMPKQEAGMIIGGISLKTGIHPPSGVPKGWNGSRVGRNEKCPCGSDKKYKKCCGSHSLL